MNKQENTPPQFSLIIIHYHLRRGGVTDVIKRALSVLLNHPQILHITVVVGEEMEILFDDFIISIFPHANEQKINTVKEKLTIQVASCVGYIDDTHDTITLEENLQSLFNSIHQANTFWWVHNHHLGKNPIYTKALMEYTRNHKVPCLFQVHDFPEAARYENLSRLKKTMNMSEAYHTTDKSIIGVINSFDLRLLQSCKINTILIPNIVPKLEPKLEMAHTHNALSLQKTNEIKSTLSTSFPEYITSQIDANYLLFTYPVRCIRRKNVLEAALITQLYAQFSNTPSLLCVTLEGTSQQEQGYSKIVESLFTNKTIQGFFNIGDTLEPLQLNFNDVCKASDLILSSSTQEGFGFSYFNTILWQSPLLARNIPVSKDIIPLLSDLWPHFWYDSLLIPSHLLSQSQLSLINSYYQNKLLSLQQYYSDKQLVKISEEIQNILQHDYIDFSFLPISIQTELLQQSENIIKDLMASNEHLLQEMHRLIHEKQKITIQSSTLAQERIQSLYGEAVFNNVFINVCEQLQNSMAQSNEPNEQTIEAIQNSFLRAENIRALYDPV